MAGSKTAPPKKCPACQRGPEHADGCSHVDCPCRKHITAQVPHHVTEFGLFGGCYRRTPTNKEK